MSVERALPYLPAGFISSPFLSFLLASCVGHLISSLLTVTGYLAGELILHK